MARQLVPFRPPLTLEYDTCKEAFEDILFRFLYDPEFKPAYRGGPRCTLNDITVVVHNPAPDINFIQCGMTQRRWAKFVREYIDGPTIRGFCGAFWSRQPGQEIAYWTPPIANHSLGNCLIALTVNGHPPFRLRGLTRSSQWTPTGALDMSFLAIIAERLSDIAQLDKTMPIVFEAGNIWLMVLAAGNYLTTIPGELDRLRNYVETDPDPSWAAKETMKHINNAINNKTINWATFRRMWGKTRENIARLESGERLEEFYPDIPYSFTSPFKEGSYNIEQMEELLGVTKKWILHRTHQFRRFISTRWGLAVPQTFDMHYSQDHPEFKAVMAVYHHGGSVDTLEEILAALNLESEQEALDYCVPFYTAYSETGGDDDGR